MRGRSPRLRKDRSFSVDQVTWIAKESMNFRRGNYEEQQGYRLVKKKTSFVAYPQTKNVCTLS